jgi:Icc protein
MTSIKIAQITDLHLLANEGSVYYGIDTALSLDKVLAKLSTHSVDLIIASGDLAEDGKAETYQRLAVKLKSLGVPIFFTPGNHDCSTSMAKYLSDANLSYCFNAELFGWGFLFLDSQISGQSYGEIGESQLAKIKQYLIEQADKPVLIALHHPTFTVCPTTGCQLQDAAALHKLLSEHSNVKALIAGHTHNDQQDLSQSYNQYVTPSSFACATHHPDETVHSKDDFWAGHQLHPDKIGFRLINLQSDGAVESEVIWA